MPYRFKPRESVSKGVRRILLGQITAAEQALCAVDIDTGVHSARKAIKRIRALLRLVRPALPKRLFDAENARFRDIARLLAGSRDLRVMLDTLDLLRKGAPREACKAITVVAKHLEATGPVGDAAADDAAIAAAQAALAKASREIADLDVEVKAFDVLVGGLERIYRKGRRLRHAAFQSEDDEDLHDLRKMAQIHWRHMLLLSASWPEMAAARVTLAREVAQLLGEDHDFAILKAYVADRDKDFDRKVREHIAALCEAGQGEARRQAEPLADLLFVEHPAALADRIRDYWKVARSRPRAKGKRKGAEASPAPARAPARAAKDAKRIGPAGKGRAVARPKQ